MKIAVYQNLPPGGARTCLDEIVSLLHKDHDVHLFSEPFDELPDGFFNRVISDWRALVTQKFKQKKLAETIDSAKFDIVLVTHDQFLQSPWVLRYLKTPAVFLCQEPTRSYCEYFLRIPADWPLVNRLYESVIRLLRKKYEEENANFADLVVANSCYSAESLFRAYGVNAQPVLLGYNPNQFYQEKTPKLNQVLIVGNDEPQKNLDLAINALAEIEGDRPKLVIKSPRQYDHSRLEKLARSKNLELEIVESRTRDQLRELYSASILTLATARLEPFGLSVVESMACGTPVVAVNEGGFRETVIHGQTGFLVERDSSAIAKAIGDLLKHPDKAREMGQAGVKHVAANFTWDKTVSHLVKLFEDVKNRKRRHHRS